jgi:putative adhesin
VPPPSNWACALLLSLSLFCSLLTVAARAAVTEVEHVNKTATLPSGGTLRVNNFSGRVTITGTDRADASIDAVRRATRRRLDNIKLDIHTEGTTLVVNANRHDDSWWFGHNGVVDTDLDIKVPHNTNLDVDVFSASVTVEGVEGTHKLHGFSSRMRLTDVTGPVRVHTFSGSVEVAARAWVPDQVIDVNTFSGNVALHLPETARGTVSFDSFSGRLNSDIPLTLRSTRRRSVRAELGSGPTGGTLRLKTFSGSVKIDR